MTHPRRSIVAILLLAAVTLAGPAAAQEFAPAVVFDMGGKFDKSFNEAAYNGAERFKKQTGIVWEPAKGRIKQIAGKEPNLSSLTSETGKYLIEEGVLENPGLLLKELQHEMSFFFARKLTLCESASPLRTSSSCPTRSAITCGT